MGCVFSSNSWPSINQHCTTVKLLWLLTFDYLFWVCFSLTLTILLSNLATLIPKLPYWPIYIMDLYLGPTYLPPNYLPFIFSWLNLYLGKIKLISLSKTFISSWLNLYLFAKLISFGKTFTCWQNLYLFLVKPLPFGKTFNYSCWNFYLLTKPISFIG